MSKQEFDGGRITLYQGDSLQIIKHLSNIDAVVTDPPYSSGGFTRGDRMQSTGSKYQASSTKKKHQDFFGDNQDQRAWTLWSVEWLRAALLVTKPGATFCLFTDWRQIPAITDAMQWAGIVWRGLAVWDKINTRPQPNGFKQQAEFIPLGTNGGRETDYKNAFYFPGVFTFNSPSTENRQHMTQKPVEVMDQLVRVAPRDGVVLDPFMGSGTTAVAAIAARRRFIGIELSPHFFDVSCQRVEQALKQRGLFDEIEPEKEPEQQELEI